MKLQLAGRLSEAEKIYGRVLELNPNSHDAMHLLGLVKAESDQDEAGARLIEAAIKLRPEVAAFRHNIAGVYRRIGKLKEAETEFREAIRLKPDYAEAYQGLAEMIKFEPDDQLLNQIEAQLSNDEVSPNQASYFHFAAGKVLDDQGHYESAFQHYEQGNSDAKRSFSTQEYRQKVKDNLYQFSPQLIERLAGAGSTSKRPFFVVGMPRSGTSLVEQILASHSRVFGAGELNDMKFIAHDGIQLTGVQQAYPGYVAELTAEHLQTLANRYLDRTSTSGSDHVVDKHPLNFNHIGLILLMFPNAKVIHTERHALDTCLSCFFQNFTKGQDYSFNLETLGEFYLDYQRLMAHWHQVFPGRIFDISYESLLADLEGETRRMLDYCDLPYEAECLSFYETKRSVKTASFLQVRQPLYQTSQGRWRNYERQLRPLARKLGLDSELQATNQDRVDPSDEAPVTISTLGRLL